MTGEAQSQGFQLSEFSEKAYRSIAECNSRINVWHGAVRSGKTISSLIAWGLRLATRPDRHAAYMMVGRTRGTLERNCVRPLIAIWGSDAVQYAGPHSDRLFFCGRLVYLIGANDEKADEKVQGSTLTDAYGDEVTTWHESMFKMLMSRLSVSDAQFYGTTNPDSPGHWLKREYLDRESELDLSQWHFTLDDNTALPPEYVEALKKEYTGLWYRRYVLGEWTQAEGAVYDRMPDAMFLEDDDPQIIAAREFGDRYFAIDYGTTNPLVCLDCYVYRDRLYVVDEWRHDSTAAGYQMTNRDYAEKLYRFAGHPDYVRSAIVDPSASSFKLELQEHQFSVRGGDNAVLSGIQQVASLIGQGRMFIAKGRCAATIEELRGYRWDSRRAATGNEAPVKEKDHGPDALRYLVATLKLSQRVDERDAEPWSIQVYDDGEVL